MSAGGTCLWRRCHQLTESIRRGAMVWACLSHTGRKRRAGNTSPPWDTRTRCGWKQHRRSSSCHQHKLRELCFEWSRTHRIAHCNWNTLHKVPDLPKERKQHFGINFLQPGLQHNDVMVKKQAAETLLYVVCWEWGNVTITPITTAKGNLLTHTFEEHALPECSEVVEIICLKEQVYVHTETD
jgi:hypothetical protein